MNTYYIDSERHLIDTAPSGERLWSVFMDAVAALDAYQEYVLDLQSMLSGKEDDNADLRDKVAELEELIAELEAKLAEASER